MARMNPILRLLVHLDIQALAILSLGASKHNETISACLWELDRDGRWHGMVLRRVVDFLFAPWGYEHCRGQWLYEESQRKRT